jgi:hypothetical protein
MSNAETLPAENITPIRSMVIPQTTSANQLLAVLSRMMADPSVDIERIERGAALYERALARDAETSFNDAMARAQAAMRRVKTDAKSDKGLYATYAAVDNIARPVYAAHGFSISFDTGEGAPEGYNRILCYVSHGAHTRTYRLDMAADGKGPKGNDVMTKTHAGGASITYGRRYLLGMIFNLVIGEDTDGNASEGGITGSDFPGDKFLTAAETAHLRELLKNVGCSEDNFLRAAKRERVEDIPAANYDRCVKLINSYKGPRQ